MNTTTVTTPNELEIRVERIFDAPRTHVYSVWTDPELIPEWWGDGTVVEEMDVRPGGTYRFRAHSMFDAQLYRQRAELETWRQRDPITRLQAWLAETSMLHAEEVERIEAEVAAEIDAAVAFAEAGTLEHVEELERFTIMDRVPQ